MSDLKNRPKLARTAEFAWPGGDRPGELGFSHPVEPQLASAILAAIGAERGDVSALMPPNGPLGRYRVCVDSRALFVRVSARWAEPQIEQALTGFLSEHGIAVNHLEVAGEEFPFGDKVYRFDVRQFLHARHFNGSLDDLRAVATLLARCHATLRGFPRATDVKALAAKRFGRLVATLAVMKTALEEKAWSRFAADPAWAEQRAEWLQAMIAQADLRFDLEPGAQCVHAQVHRGNVLFHISDSAPVLLDFEEAVHTFATPAWDTAHFIQRFCLHDEPDTATLALRISAAREAYGAPLGDIALMMRRIAWLSIAILVSDHLEDGASSPVAEYEKFVNLETQARKFAQ